MHPRGAATEAAVACSRRLGQRWLSLVQSASAGWGSNSVPQRNGRGRRGEKALLVCECGGERWIWRCGGWWTGSGAGGSHAREGWSVRQVAAGRAAGPMRAEGKRLPRRETRTRAQRSVSASSVPCSLHCTRPTHHHRLTSPSSPSHSALSGGTCPCPEADAPRSASARALSCAARRGDAATCS